jgi:predicted nuclease with TOPRIM domain
VFGLDGRKAALRRAADQLQQQGGGGPQALEDLLLQVEALLELPDPSHALGGALAATKRAADLEAEVRQLGRDLKEARADVTEVQQLVAAHDEAKADNARLRAELEEVQSELASLRSTAGASVRSQEQLKAATDEAAGLRGALAKLRGEYEASQSQLFDTLAALEQARGAAHNADEVAAALDEVDRLTRQAVGLAAQRDALQRQVERQREQRDHEQLASPSAANAAGKSLERTASSAGSDFSHGGLLSPRVGTAARDTERHHARGELEAALSRVREAEHQGRLLQSRLEVAEAQAARLQAEVQRRPSPEQHSEAVAAVAALSSLLGRQLEQEGWEQGAAAAAVAGLAADPGLLQSQLQERVSKLADALTSATREAEGLRSQRDAARQRVDEAEAQLAEAREAARQLEADLQLAAAGPVEALGSGGGGDQGGAASQGLNTASMDAPTSPTAEGDGAPMLSVVVRQRDRFAARVAGLEEECSALQARVASLAGQGERLTRDNVELVEQIRYLKHRQVAGGGGGGGGGRAAAATVIRVDSSGVQQQEAKAARYACGPIAFDVRRRGQGDGGGGALAAEAGSAEAAYTQHYQRALNPFADFKRSEVEGRVRGMKLHDRLMLAAGGAIAGSPAARAAVFGYLVLVHVYIMAVLYARASPSAAGCAAGAAAGGGGGGGGAG